MCHPLRLFPLLSCHRITINCHNLPCNTSKSTTPQPMVPVIPHKTGVCTNNRRGPCGTIIRLYATNTTPCFFLSPCSPAC
jgi:hypothetical protein